MTAAQDGLDPAAVMDQHQPGCEEADNHESYCLNYDCEMRDWPCLPYRLAALALDLLAERDELLRRVEQAERAAVVKALRNLARSLSGPEIWGAPALVADADLLNKRADAIENGADYE